MPPISLGTSAWSYPDWTGILYPHGLPRHQWLAWYARFFNAVEVDSTFYHPPTPKVAADWVAATPPEFTFTLKLSREITHQHRLREAGPLLCSFLEGAEPLGEKLGAILIQLPAGFHPRSDAEALRRFVHQLPQGWPFAIEFRDEAWAHEARIVHALQARNVCWAWTDTEPYSHQAEGAFEWLPLTADFLYLRLLGDLKTKYDPEGKRIIERYDHLRWDRARSLANWAVKIRHHLTESRRTLLFAANHFEGCSPLTAQRFGRELGVTITLPEPGEPEQEEEQLGLF